MVLALCEEIKDGFYLACTVHYKWIYHIMGNDWLSIVYYSSWRTSSGCKHKKELFL